mmetsp:Transcript_21751/g.49504  ORF Transcript_21751/g.49504 Transcript_21751/m.49504 type:complete len:249 (+) Transcript_21751:43-789(+)
MVVEVKVRAFRDFATSLATQLVEQLCAEFEREVQYLYGDCSAYRGELGRVANLLSDQVQREKVLHEMMASMQFTMNAALGDSSRAEDMKSPMVAAEQELGRIMQLLSQPMIPEAQETKLLHGGTTREEPQAREMAPKLAAPTGVPPVLPQAPHITASTTSIGTSLASPHRVTVHSAPNTPRSGGYSISAPPMRMVPQSPGVGFPHQPSLVGPPPSPSYHHHFAAVPPLVAAQGPTPGSVVVLPAAPMR